jgi:hypothetical protein
MYILRVGDIATVAESSLPVLELWTHAPRTHARTTAAFGVRDDFRDIGGLLRIDNADTMPQFPAIR